MRTCFVWSLAFLIIFSNAIFATEKMPTVDVTSAEMLSVPTQENISLYVKQAENGNANSALWLSRYFGNQKTSSYNLKESAAWLARAAMLGSKVAITEIGFEKPYLTETRLQCSGKSISVETVCSSIDKSLGRPACYSQRIEFKNNNNSERSYFLLNENYKDDLTVAYEMECLNLSEKSLAILRSTNFGSGNTCLDCEREDYFSADGLYLGSTNSARGRRILRGYKNISQTLQNAIQQHLKQPSTHKQIFEIKQYPFGN